MENWGSHISILKILPHQQFDELGRKASTSYKTFLDIIKKKDKY